MQPSRLSVAIPLLTALSVAACTKKAEPARESKEGLEQALKGVEQAEEGFKRMKERGETLQQKVDEQTKLLDSTIAKHVSLLRSRIDADEKLIAGLSAERQAVLLPLVADLKQQMSAVEAAFHAYRGSPSAKVEEAERNLPGMLDKLNTAFAQIDAKIREAEVK